MAVFTFPQTLSCWWEKEKKIYNLDITEYRDAQITVLLDRELFSSWLKTSHVSGKIPDLSPKTRKAETLQHKSKLSVQTHLPKKYLPLIKLSSDRTERSGMLQAKNVYFVGFH